MPYIPTPLEKSVSEWYIEMNFHQPEDIDIIKICRLFRIYYKEKPMDSHYIECGRFKSIIVDSRVKPAEQREQFFHELCHILRHAGRQIMMPKAFRELQEWDSKRFTRYAAIPNHMLRFIDYNSSDAVTLTSEMFGITPELVIERFTEIKRRVELKLSESVQHYVIR